MVRRYTRDADVAAELANEALGSPRFVRLVLSGPRAAGGLRRVEIRPVLAGGRQVFNVRRYDDQKCLTSNVESSRDPQIQGLLSDFRHLTAQTAEDRTEAKVTKRGRTLVSVVAEGESPDLQHDRKKHTLIQPDAPFLESLGLSSHGAIKPSQQRKWRQINEFLRLLTAIPLFSQLVRLGTLRIADLGSGNAYLTFATYHYISGILGVRCVMVGIDRDAGIVARAEQRVRSLGWEGLTFRQGGIEDVQLERPPHIVVSLHACDTGSDEAALRALGWGSEALLLAPCCHHNLQEQLKTQHGGAGPLLRPGVLRERLGDVLTDALRASLLASLGYRTEVVQFVSPEHTAKNLMIRAWRDNTVDRERHRREYEKLRDEWRVKPYLETLLQSHD